MSSLKLKPQRSTRSFVGVVTLWVTVALGLAAHGSLHDPTDLTTLSCRLEFWRPWGWGTYVGAFMAQYVVSSVIQGLLGRQPDMMGSWGTYCSLNLMYLPGVVAGGDQGHQPQPPWGHDGDVWELCRVPAPLPAEGCGAVVPAPAAGRWVPLSLRQVPSL